MSNEYIFAHAYFTLGAYGLLLIFRPILASSAPTIAELNLLESVLHSSCLTASYVANYNKDNFYYLAIIKIKYRCYITCLGSIVHKDLA